MKLPDFRDFAPFNCLRQRMGGAALGQFELFDPARQLSRAELEALAGAGMKVAAPQLQVLADTTLAFKNARVLVADAASLYHLAACTALRQQLPAPVTLQVCTPFTGALPALLHGSVVCPACLAHLHIQGAGHGRQQRRQQLQAEVQRQFALADWCRRYPPYPLQGGRALVF